MSVILNDYYTFDYDEEIMEQGYNYPAIVDLDELDTIRVKGTAKIVLSERVRDWVEASCAGEAILAMEQYIAEWLIIFNDPTDALLFKIQFPLRWPR